MSDELAHSASPRALTDADEDVERGDGAMRSETKLERRTFLQASLAGVAASLVVPATPALASVEEKCSGENPCRGPEPVPAEATLEAAGEKIDPTTAFETWNEPWVWRPSDWPGQQLDLQVVENQNPGLQVGLGNPGSVIFSFGGNTPGPTIRMRGDEILFVKLRNHLGQDDGRNFTGPNPDPNELTPELDEAVCRAAGLDWTGSACQATTQVCGEEQTRSVGPAQVPEAVSKVIGKELRDDFCLGEHINGVHANRVTNLHTHGLHVRPDRNPNGTHSDNVILRVMPQRDLERREENALEPSCTFLRKPQEIYFLRDDESAGEAAFEFRLGDVMGDPSQPHPPGTHWYHPHSHGATHNQVASGMAGFLVVEGDVDEAVNEAFTGRPDPDPTRKTGPFDYRERLMFMQRVFPGNVSADPDAFPGSPLRRTSALPLVNGSNDPTVITMRPGAVERWRVINGSVDGRAYKRFMVAKGQYEVVTVDASNPTGDRLFYVPQKGKPRVAPYQQLEDCKQQLYQLAQDGITLVEKTAAGGCRYFVKDLAQQNPGTSNPVARCLDPKDPNGSMLENINAAFRDAKSIRDTFVRPNELYMTAANRADFFFRAPMQGKDECTIYTVLAKAVVVHSDNPVLSLQQAVAAGKKKQNFGPTDIVIAHIVVRGEPVRETIELEDLPLPPVPPYLVPIDDADLQPTKAEVEARGISPKSFRTRTITYSGWGSQDFPLIEVPEEFVRENPQLDKLFYARTGPEKKPVLLPQAIRTMAIDGRKFMPDDPVRPRAFVIIDEEQEKGPKKQAAEEWALYNTSSMLWGDVGEDQPSYQYKAHYVAYPITRGEGNRRFAENHDFQAVTRAVDHPFHIHQNPFWVTRIEIPDENGELVNILDQPRWMDTVWIPRNVGRVVFRSRFPDFVGTWVNHCHLLLHEDNGMMQPVQGTPFAEETNYVARERVAGPGDSSQQVDEIYPRPSLEDAYRRNAAFHEPTAAWSEQPNYPGFPVEPPQLPEEGS